MWRLIGILLTVVYAIAVAIVTWPQFFRLEQTFPVAQMVAVRGVVTAGLGVIFLLALLLAIPRRTRSFFTSIAIVSVIGAAIGTVVMVSRGIGADTLPDKTDESVRVMVWNTAGPATDAEAIARTAVAMEADIVSLPETTIETGEAVAIAMRELGSPMWAWNERYEGWDANSTTLLISPDLGDYAVVESTSNGTANTTVVPSVVAMPVSGDGPIVVAVHAIAPRPEYMSSWRQDLAWVADQCASDNVILAGDFNASLDNLGKLGTDGGDVGRCTDAAAQTGNGSVGTWPTTVPTPFGAAIDRVMATDYWRADGSVVLTSLDEGESDHRPVVVQYSPAPAESR